MTYMRILSEGAGISECFYHHFLHVYPYLTKGKIYMYTLMSLRQIHIDSCKGQNSTDLQDQVCLFNVITFSKST